MVLIEAPKQIQQTVSISENHKEVCSAANVNIQGNAAANVDDFLDLSGQNSQPGWIPSGFTARGIVAMVFSCISAIAGLISITIYGLSDRPRKSTSFAHSSQEETPYSETPEDDSNNVESHTIARDGKM